MTKSAGDIELQLFRATFESAPVGMVMSDADGNIVMVNAEVERMFEHARNELIGKKVEALLPERLRGVHPGHRARFNSMPGARPMGAGRELYGARKDGSEFPLEIGLSAVKTAEGLFILSTLVDITKRKQLIAAKEKAETLATHDYLTGLPNRVLLLDRLEHALAIAKRNIRMAALITVDIDDFKAINDTHGHGVGDRLLVAIAERMKHSLRESDTVTRWGGDEFLILAPEIDEVGQAATLAEHILANLRNAFELDGLTLRVTFSLGVALFPRDATTAEALIAESDRALYRAKRLGKDRFAFAS